MAWPTRGTPAEIAGAGVFAIVATTTGIYIGHDTDVVGGEYHPRVAFFPLSGGLTPTPIVEPKLPTTLYSVRPDGELLTRTYNGSAFGAAQSAGTGWGHVRGTFTVNHSLYTGLDDGRILKRNFSGTTFTPAIDIHSWIGFANSTGMFFSGGRLYYTLAGDKHLYFRKFEPQDGLVGSQLFAVSGNGDGLDWSTTRGMAVVGGKVYVADSLGYLRSISLFGGGRSSTPPRSSAVRSSTGGTGHRSACSSAEGSLAGALIAQTHRRALTRCSHVSSMVDLEPIHPNQEFPCVS